MNSVALISIVSTRENRNAILRTIAERLVASDDVTDDLVEERNIEKIAKAINDRSASCEMSMGDPNERLHLCDVYDSTNGRIFHMLIGGIYSGERGIVSYLESLYRSIEPSCGRYHLSSQSPLAMAIGTKEDDASSASDIKYYLVDTRGIRPHSAEEVGSDQLLHIAMSQLCENSGSFFATTPPTI